MTTFFWPQLGSRGSAFSPRSLVVLSCALGIACSLGIGCERHRGESAPAESGSKGAQQAPTSDAKGTATAAPERPEGPGEPDPPDGETQAAAPQHWDEELLRWRFEDDALGEMVVLVRVPETRERLPLLVTMHGLGEATKGPKRGARGWLEDYHLDRTLARLEAPPLRPADLEGLAHASRLAALNESLERRPYRGMVVAMPYTPNILEEDRSLDAARPLGRFLVEALLPRLRRETPVLDEPEATGIDGVSLGGRAALAIGLEHPDTFGVVGSLQAAIYPQELDALTERAGRAREGNPELRLRLLTSSGDFYRKAITQLSRRWNVRGIDHQLDVVAGPHSYAFNRGPGGYEMLLFHDRALRGEPYLRP